MTKLLKHQKMDEVHEAADLKRSDHCLLVEHANSTIKLAYADTIQRFKSLSKWWYT
jgi:hypothetical protein